MIRYHPQDAKKKILVFLQEKPWTLIRVFCFLNEMENFNKVSRRFFSINQSENDTKYKFTFVHSNNNKYKIWVEIGNQIQVIASSDWMLSEWELSSSDFFSLLRNRNRIRAAPKLQTHYFFKFEVKKLSAGTLAILQNIPVLYTGIYDYSCISHHFIKRLITKSQIPYDEQTKFFHDYYNVFILPKNKYVYNLETLKQNLKGYLKLNVQQSEKKKRLQKILHEGSEYYIINGIFISTYAKSILSNDNDVEGLFLDTTWKVMNHYVTSILMAIQVSHYLLHLAQARQKNYIIYILKHLRINLELT